MILLDLSTNNKSEGPSITGYYFDFDVFNEEYIDFFSRHFTTCDVEANLEKDLHGKNSALYLFIIILIIRNLLLYLNL